MNANNIKICSLFLFAFICVMRKEVRMPRAHDCMDAGGRATQGAVADDCMDAGGRATQGAVAEERRHLRTPAFHLRSVKYKP